MIEIVIAGEAWQSYPLVIAREAWQSYKKIFLRDFAISDLERPGFFPAAR
jgi:hypothetical protein